MATLQTKVNINVKNSANLKEIFNTMVFYANPKNYPDKVTKDNGKKAVKLCKLIEKKLKANDFIGIETV